jgi:hypothetical protein
MPAQQLFQFESEAHQVSLNCYRTDQTEISTFPDGLLVPVLDSHIDVSDVRAGMFQSV